MFASLTLTVVLPAAIGVATTPTEPEDGTLTPFEQSLDRLPATAFEIGDVPQLTYVDMELAWQRAGVGENPDERLDHLSQLFDPATWAQTPQLFGSSIALVDEARTEVGFTAFEIDREIAVLAPPRQIIVAETSVAASEVVAAVERDPVWSAELAVIDTPDGTYFEWGDDPAATNLDRRSPMRQLGQGGQLAVLGDESATVVRTIDSIDVEAALATASGREESLLDLTPWPTSTRPLADAVAALGDGDVVQAIMVAQPTVFSPPLGAPAEEITEIIDAMVLLQPYGGVLIVELLDGDQPHTEVLLLHVDDAAAADNAALTEDALTNGIDPATGTPLRELLTDAEVTVHGTVVRVTLPAEGSYRLASTMLYERSLFPT